MPVIRTYYCRDCEKNFEITCGMNDPDPECPVCKDLVLDWVPTKFAIGGSVQSAAVDVTQKILEDDYGQTNWNDSMREGDIAHKATPKTRDEQNVIAKLEHDAKEFAAQSPKANPAFWGGGAGGPPSNMIAAAMAGAREQSALANAEGRNPMKLLNEAGKKGELNIPFRPIMRG